MEDLDVLKKHLDHMSRELLEIRKLVFGIKSNRKCSESSESSEQAWEDLMEASEEISKLWKDSSAVEEIRSQREKSW